MPSSFKTEHLSLNKFQGSDKPKMADFNYDNQTIDTAMKLHQQSVSLHKTPEDIATLKRARYVWGSYTGDGQAYKTVTLGFVPAMGFLFAGSQELLLDFTTLDGMNCIRFGFISPVGCSAGITLTTTGFKAKQLNTVPDTKCYRFNETGITYHYVAFKGET